MPPYVDSPFALRTTLQPGVPAYSYGGFDDHNPGTKIQVATFGVTSNVATITGKIVEGYDGSLPTEPLAVVGQLISTQGLLQDVTDVAIASISINTTTGVVTITYDLTHADVGPAAASGFALIPAQETGEALVEGAGEQFAMQAFQGLASNSRDLSWVVSTPSAPDSFTAKLQIADVDQDSEYTDFDSTTAAGVRVAIGVRANFVRIAVTAVSGGTDPTIIGKILE